MRAALEKLRLLSQNTTLDGRTRTVIVGLCAIVLAFVLLWFLDRLFLLTISRSYVDQIASVFDLNRYLAQAISLALCIVLVRLASLSFSFSRRKRTIGALGIVSLFIANSLVLWQGTKGQFFEASGTATKCFVLTHEGVRFGERPGIDLQTGKPCRPVTPELMDRLQAYARGQRPEPVTTDDPAFFDLTTGEPSIWYLKTQNGEIELFDLMGFHPGTGEELQPITKEIVQLWRSRQRQLAERAPKQVDPQTFTFFDPKTGNPRGWYWHAADNSYEFYDNKGFEPKTGEPLKAVTAAVLGDWKNQTAKKCYVVTRDTVEYRNTLGVDPETGRECRPFTPSLLERLKDYEKGLRPKRITSSDITFFDLRTGEPNVWYSRDDQGHIKLFDLIGFDPESGQELLPVNTEIVNSWKKQVLAVTQKPPKLVDPNSYAFFDTVTGEPQVWYWQDANGDWEFYDNPGFRSTGEKLTLISQTVIDLWRRQVAERAQQEAARVAETERKRISDQEALQQTQEAEATRQREQAAKAEMEQQAGDRCDRTAANPTDAQKPSDIPGVEYNDLKLNPQAAIDACSQAVKVFPTELRFRYELARALEFTNPQRAINIYVMLVKNNYVAAHDNFGGVLLRERKDLHGAIKEYETGVRLGDPSAMLSLAYLIKHNLYSVANPDAMRHALLVKAAQAGVAGAQDALDKEQQEAQARSVQQQSEEEQQRMMMEVFGGIVRGFAR